MQLHSSVSCLILYILVNHMAGFVCNNYSFKSHCSTVNFRRIISIYEPTNARIISHKTNLKHFKTLRHVSILSDHHHGALFLAKVILQYSQCVVEQWLGVRRTTHT